MHEAVAAQSPEPASGRPPSYLDPDCRLTLREGLEEYWRAMPDLLDEGVMDERSRSLFHNHDIAHVVFGCDISLPHEGMVDTWTMFGTDIGVRAYLEYATVPEAKQVASEVGYARMAWESLKAVRPLYLAFRGARRMAKRWPFFDHEAYLDRPLDEIRREFGIVIVG